MFAPGMLVECVDDSDHPEWEAGYVPIIVSKELRCGAVYTVRDVGRDPQDNWPVLWLVEVVRPTMGADDPEWRGTEFENYEVGFAQSRFRPLTDSRLAIFRKLLVPSPKHERETA